MKVLELMERVGIKETGRAKNHLNTKDEYRKIPRMVYEPLIEDADEV